MSKIRRIETNHKQILMSNLDNIVITAKKDLFDFINYDNNKQLAEDETIKYIVFISKILCNESNTVLFDFLYNSMLTEYRAMKMSENQLSLL